MGEVCTHPVDVKVGDMLKVEALYDLKAHKLHVEVLVVAWGCADNG